jgi:hypothetical protein
LKTVMHMRSVGKNMWQRIKLFCLKKIG